MAKLVSVLLNIFRELGILGLVCLGLCKKQLLNKFLRSQDVEHAAQEIVLCHIQKHKTPEIQRDSVLEHSHCILLFIGVKMLGNDHTSCGESIALHQHAPKFKAIGLESGSSLSDVVKRGRTFLTKSGYVCASVHSTPNFP